MIQTLICLLVLFFSFSGPAMEGNASFWQSPLAADTGANIALGSRYSGLRTFASDIGADHLLDVPNNQWKDVFLSHVDNPSTTFHVNMGGFFGDTPSEMILNEMQNGSHTGWELQQLQQAGRLHKRIFINQAI